MPEFPIAIIGAGPVGLAAAAHLAERGLQFVVLEAGARVGHAVRHWAHVRMFSPWRFNVDPAAGRLLGAANWVPPSPDRLPTGGELAERYLDPLAALPALASHIRLGARVVAVGRHGMDKVPSGARDAAPFALQVEAVGGVATQLLARAVIDTSGTWFSPNPLGSSGYPVPGEAAAADRIDFGIPDVLGRRRADFAGRTTVVVGSGHSAMNAVLDLAGLAERTVGTKVFWAIRQADTGALFAAGGRDALQARGLLSERARRSIDSGGVKLLTGFRVSAVERRDDERLILHATVGGRDTAMTVDRIVAATGFRPDFSFLREVRLSLDPWLEASAELAPLIDPNVHSCGTVPPHGFATLAHAEKNFYIAGVKSYGRAPTFLLATGYEQVRSIAAALAGDMESASRVALALPSTGVCSTDRAAVSAVAGCCEAPVAAVRAAASACCGGPAKDDPDACCVADAQAKADGKTGCGCQTAAAPAA